MIRQRYIYKFTSPTGRIYVGQTVNIKKRLGQYKSCNPEQKLIYRSLKKHGLENHKFEILEDLICDNEAIDGLEIKWIAHFKCNHKKFPELGGLNLNDGGKSVNPQGMSPESRQKMSDAAKGRIPWNKGKKGVYSEETIDKIRQANIGKKRPNKSKMNDETKKKISNGLKGIKQSKETKLKRTNTILSNMLENKSASIVFDDSTGIFFDSISQAALSYNIKRSTLCWYLSNKNKNKTNLKYA